jgi:hypothetical protein
MSRSGKKQPFVAHTTASSDKPFKQRASRTLRRASKQKLATTLDGDSLPARYELVNPWESDKDGKSRVLDPADKRLRK